MKRDTTIIGYREMDNPELRRDIRFGIGPCKGSATVRGIAIHLVDERDNLRQAVQELVHACDEKFGCVRFDANLSPTVIDVLESLGLH